LEVSLSGMNRSSFDNNFEDRSQPLEPYNAVGFVLVQSLGQEALLIPFEP